jgi:hypothetical protein
MNNNFHFVVLLAAGLAVPGTAMAQRNDQAYCEALSDLYVQYIGHDIESGGRTRPTGSPEAQIAVAQCRQRNPAPAIPVLERTLRSNGFSLPKPG